MASGASVLDGFAAARRYRRTQHILAAMMLSEEGVRGVSTDEQRIERWLSSLRDGSEGQKLAARRGLAAVFEQRGMLEEAIELLESNVQAGVRGAETLRWLSRLYQAQEDEVRSLEAAVKASQYPAVPAVEAQAPPRPRAIRRPMPYLLILVGLGITVGTVLWLLTPFLKP